MDRHINLYRKHRQANLLSGRGLLQMLLGTIGLCLVATAALAYRNYALGQDVERLIREQEEKSSQKKQLESEVLLREKATANDAEQTRARRAEADSRLRDAQKLLSELPLELSAETRSFWPHLRALAELAGGQVWITSFSVGALGKEVTIRGKSLRREDVLSYARRAAERFALLGVRFEGLSISEERPGVEEPGDAPAEEKRAAASKPDALPKFQFELASRPAGAQ